MKYLLSRNNHCKNKQKLDAFVTREFVEWLINFIKILPIVRKMSKYVVIT